MSVVEDFLTKIFTLETLVSILWFGVAWSVGGIMVGFPNWWRCRSIKPKVEEAYIKLRKRL